MCLEILPLCVSLPLWFPSLLLCLSLLMGVQINRVRLRHRPFALKPIVPGTLYKQSLGLFSVKPA